MRKHYDFSHAKRNPYARRSKRQVTLGKCADGRVKRRDFLATLAAGLVVPLERSHQPPRASRLKSAR